MNAQEESFESYLRCEVDSAGKRYDQTVERVFNLLGGPDVQAGPALLDATLELSESLRLYAGAIRRMAHVAAHESIARETRLSVHV